MSYQLSVDFNVIRKMIANEIQKVTNLVAILEEPESTQAPRPRLPYFSFKLTTPAAKTGDDSSQLVANSYSGGKAQYSSGGVRRMSLSFHCYAEEHESAYNFMALWQSALELKGVQEDLRKVGIAVWIIGNVADLSQLLNTGYEARAQMDVQCGLAINLVETLGTVGTVNIDGTIDKGNSTLDLEFTVPES